MRAAGPTFAATVALFVATAATPAAPATAAERTQTRDDGAYGRLDGDLTLAATVGVGIAAPVPLLATSLSATYLHTAGVYFGYADALGQADATVAREASIGVRLLPLFWGRYASNLERGPARLDLLIDSFAIEMGAVWFLSARGQTDAAPGLEVALGLGLPLFASATGPFVCVRGALRVRPQDFEGGASGDLAERGAMLTFAVAWEHVVAAHLADAGDRKKP